MEPAGTFKLKLTDFKTAVNSFEKSLLLDLNHYKGVELDTIKSGQIQKFEYCIELCWKTLKLYLNDKHSLDSVSPKDTIKKFFGINLIDENDYELLIQMLDDRNRLSHIYNEMFFDEIHSRLKNYLKVLKKITNKLK